MGEITTRAATDSDFNAISRTLTTAVHMYFDGLDQDPLIITHDNYLVDWDLLDEAGAENANPLGAISSNELTLSLLNPDGLFSPTNTESPYYGKIKLGITIKLYVGVADPTVAISPMGVFYVTDWNASITGSVATVVANDQLQKVLNSSTPSLPVQMQVAFDAYCASVFASMGYSITMDESLSYILSYAFIEGKPSSFLAEMFCGAMAYCFCNKEGNIITRNLNRQTSLRATLTDAEQIIDVEATQSIIKTYAGVALTYYLPQLTEQIQLLNLKEVTVPVGDSCLSNIEFSRGPVKRLNNLSIKSTNHNVAISDYAQTPWNINLFIKNSSTSVGVADIEAYGVAVDLVKALMTDMADNVLEVNSRYIQSTPYATTYKNVLTSFVNSNLPLLTLRIRGNPLFEIGDKIAVSSSRYNLTYQGILIRAKYTFDGGLTEEITLLDASIF